MRKIGKLFILILISIVCLVTTVMAAENTCDIKLKASKSKVEKGETFEISVEVNPKNVQEGIGAYSAQINYDTNAFEIVKIEGIGNWDDPLINNGKIIATTKDGECVKTKQEVAVVTFKSKMELKNETSTIKVEEFQTSNTKEIISADSKEVKIGSKKGEQSSKPNDIVEKKDETLSTIKIPFTGITVKIVPSIFTIIAIIAIVISIVILVKYKKNHSSK